MSDTYVLHRFPNGHCVTRLTSKITNGWANQIVTGAYQGPNMYCKKYYSLDREFNGNLNSAGSYSKSTVITKEDNPEYFI